MKNYILLLVLAFSTTIFSQKYYTKTGTLDFEASVPAFEPVKASHSTTTAVLDTETGKLAVLALVKGFRFKNALMEEHFNENYMESGTYPKASFSGTIDGFSIDDTAEGKEHIVKGELTIHGKPKTIEAPITLIKDGDTFQLSIAFVAAPEDFDIEIPNLVKEKISESINITGSFQLSKR